jgi:hypothetical protein
MMQVGQSHMKYEKMAESEWEAQSDGKRSCWKH